MRRSPENLDHVDCAGAAAYIGALSGELALLARRHGLDTLGYLLDMAKLEADGHGRNEPRPPKSLSAS